MWKIRSTTNKPKLVIVDSTFPQKEPFAFRNSEINEYFARIKNAESYTTYAMLPDADAWFRHGYGMAKGQYEENRTGYLQHYPHNKDKINYLQIDKKYSFELAYSFFLSETYVLLPFYEKNKIPFVFVLYPGGGFGIDFEKSDSMLKKIFESEFFRGVIVTQQITRDYIINKNLCRKDKVAYIYGGFVQFKKKDIKPKKYYKTDKNTFDVCFVAAKYSDRGVDKGYDLFIESAKELAKVSTDINFHVVGGFDENDIDVSELAGRITFYGYQKPDFLLNFYSGMDIFLGPGRPFKLFQGSFDGFPLGIDAGYCGVALFVSDELKMNHFYSDNEIAIVPLDSKNIAKRVFYYYNNLESLYDLSLNGSKITQKLFDIDHQIDERIKFINQFMELQING